ncbi:MAG: hypothetical protein ACREDO_11875 [Methyloceanibacter sp.]
MTSCDDEDDDDMPSAEQDEHAGWLDRVAPMKPTTDAELARKLRRLKEALKR